MQLPPRGVFAPFRRHRLSEECCSSSGGGGAANELCPLFSSRPLLLFPQVRLLLDCSDVFQEPCRGFTGNCGARRRPSQR